MSKPRSATILKIIKGTARRDRKRDDASVALGGTPVALDFVPLSDKERAVFDWIVANGLLPSVHSKMESLLIAKLAKLIVVHNEAEAKLVIESQHRLVIRTGQNSYKLSPYLRISFDALERIRLLMSELGLTPSARLRFAKPMSESTTAKGDADDWGNV
jgi:hypothetical protein